MSFSGCFRPLHHQNEQYPANPIADFNIREEANSDNPITVFNIRKEANIRESKQFQYPGEANI